MPPRFITLAILVFWLTMTGLLIHHEVVPMMLADAAPTFQPDLTDEIGSPMVSWTVLLDGKRIGSAISKVVANEDRTFEFRSSAHYDQFKIGPPNQAVYVRSTESIYHVTESGKVLSFSEKLGLSFGPNDGLPPGNAISFRVEGIIAEGVCTPHVFFEGTELPVDKVEVPADASVLNPMHLLSRRRGLKVGQMGRVPMIDSQKIIANTIFGGFLKGITIPTLIAEVKADTLTWDRKDVPCFVIEYREPTKDVTARTWVRQHDGLVLRQEVSHLGFELVSQRSPN